MNKILLTDVEIIILSAVLSIVFLVAIGLILFFAFKNKRTEIQKEVINEHSNEEFVLCLGGKENILSFELRGNNRLALVLKDYTIVDKEKLKKFYISRTLEMSDKLILVGENLNPLNNILNNIKWN